jgi:hypothetical protein
METWTKYTPRRLHYLANVNTHLVTARNTPFLRYKFIGAPKISKMTTLSI